VFQFLWYCSNSFFSASLLQRGKNHVTVMSSLSYYYLGHWYLGVTKWNAVFYLIRNFFYESIMLLLGNMIQCGLTPWYPTIQNSHIRSNNFKENFPFL
jgi:hypothetical protein